MPISDMTKQLSTPIIATSPNERIIGTVEMNIAANPMQVASIAYMTAGPVLVTVTVTAWSSDPFLASSSSRAWNWIP